MEKVISETPCPTNQTERKSFFGIAGYYRRFVCGFTSVLASTLAEISRYVMFKLMENMEEAFKQLKKAMTTPRVLAVPDFEMPYYFETGPIQ